MKNPILESSLEGYNQCTELLYQAGFRIHLLEEDEVRIEQILSLAQPMASEIQFNIADGDSKRHIGLFSNKMVMEKEDPLERYIRFKAYSSPHYLSVALTHPLANLSGLT